MPAETDPAGAAASLPGVPFAMAARARRVVAECQPWVRHWRSYARTRRMKTRESERGGAAPKACSQTRRKLAKSKPSRTTFRPTPVSCGITERSLFCSSKVQSNQRLPGAQFTARSSPRSRFEPAVRIPPVGLSLLAICGLFPRGRKFQHLTARSLPCTILVQIAQGTSSELLICGLFQKGRVLAQDRGIYGVSFTGEERHSSRASSLTSLEGRDESANKRPKSCRHGPGRLETNQVRGARMNK